MISISRSTPVIYKGGAQLKCWADSLLSYKNVYRTVSTLGLFGTAFASYSGAKRAAKAGSSFVPSLFLGLVSSTGGGAIRNSLIGQPAAWFTDPTQLRMSIAGSSYGYISGLSDLKKEETNPFQTINEKNKKRNDALLELINQFCLVGPASVFTALFAKKHKIRDPFQLCLLTYVSSNCGGIIRELCLRSKTTHPVAPITDPILRSSFLPVISGVFSFKLASKFKLSSVNRILVGFFSSIAVRNVALSISDLLRKKKEEKEKEKDQKGTVVIRVERTFVKQ